MNENENKSGFTELLLGILVAVALFLIWKKEHAVVNGTGPGTIPYQPQFQPTDGMTAAASACPSCSSCGIADSSSASLPFTNPILAAQISPTVGGTFPSVVQTVPRAPVNTIRIGVQYVSPPRAAVPTSAIAVNPYIQRTTPLTIASVGAPTRLGPSLV